MVVPRIDGYSKNRWATMTSGERLATLQRMEDALARQQPRTPCTVKAIPDDMREDGVFGWHDPLSNVICIDPSLYDPDDPKKQWVAYELSVGASEPYEAMDTLLHESRHAEQHDIATKHPELADSRQQLQDFSEGQSRIQGDVGGGYIGYRVDSTAYHFQPTEVDARRAALEGMDELYRDDPAYAPHRQRTLDDEQSASTEAQMRGWDDPEQVARGMVHQRYVAANDLAEVTDKERAMEQPSPTAVVQSPSSSQLSPAGSSRGHATSEMEPARPGQAVSEGSTDRYGHEQLSETAPGSSNEAPAEQGARQRDSRESSGQGSAAEEADESGATQESDSEIDGQGEPRPDETSADVEEAYHYYEGIGY